MNTETPFTTEFFDKETKRRKQIPIAVFTIVAAHVVLFVGLLGAAGCKQDDSTAKTDKDNAARQFAAAEYQAQVAGTAEGTTAPSTASATSEVASASTREAHADTSQYGPLEKVMISEPDELTEIPAVKTVGNTTGLKAAPITAKTMAIAPAPERSSADTYTVKSGDSLIRIAKRYGTTPKAIKAANGLKTDVIRIGQKLKISSASKNA